MLWPLPALCTQLAEIVGDGDGSEALASKRCILIQCPSLGTTPGLCNKIIHFLLIVEEPKNLESIVPESIRIPLDDRLDAVSSPTVDIDKQNCTFLTGEPLVLLIRKAETRGLQAGITAGSSK